MRRKTKPKATTPFLLAQPSPQPAPPRPSTHQRGPGPHSLSLPRGLLPTLAQLPSAPSLHRTGPASTHGPSLAALSPAHARECHPPTRRSTCQPFQPHARRPRPRLLLLSRRPHCHPLPPLPSRPRNGRGVRPRSPRIPFPNPNPAISGRPPLNRPQTPAPPPSTSAPPPNLAAAALRAQTEHSAAGKKLRHGILQRRRDSDLSDPVEHSQVHLEAVRGI